jgi:hypothetical protein
MQLHKVYIIIPATTALKMTNCNITSDMQLNNLPNKGLHNLNADPLRSHQVQQVHPLVKDEYT